MWLFSLKPNGTFTVRPDEAGAFRRTPEPSGIGAFGVKLFLASLSFLFAASILLFLILLVPADKPETPLLRTVGAGLGAATLIMLASSYTYARALAAIRADDRKRFAALMRWTLGLGVAFMVAQTVNWAQLFASGTPLFAEELSLGSQPMHGGLFLVMTVVHALHVVGGIVPLAVVTRRAGRGDYTSSHHEGASNVALYWHFLDVVWILMLTAIVAVSA